MSPCDECSLYWNDKCHYESLGSWDPAPCDDAMNYDKNEEDE